MDTWTVDQYRMMKCGGNDRATRFFEKYGVAKHTPASQKYNNDVAAAYRDKLKCAAENREWKKPKWMKSSSGGGGGSSRSSKTSAGSGSGSGSGSGCRSRRLCRPPRSRNRPKLKKGQFDLATGAGSLLQTAYRPEEHADDWRPPSPRPPKGAKEGRFLMGLTPEKWVSFLKSLDRQDDRAYHLKKMSADERAQVVACMSGAPIPAPSSTSAFGGAKGHAVGGIGDVNPFGDDPTPTARASCGSSKPSISSRVKTNDDDDDDDARARASSRASSKKKKDWDESSSDEDGDDGSVSGADDLNRRAGGGVDAIARARADRERREREAAESASRERRSDANVDGEKKPPRLRRRRRRWRKRRRKRGRASPRSRLRVPVDRTVPFAVRRRLAGSAAGSAAGSGLCLLEWRR